MSLGELIAALESADPRLVLPDGFHNPHSYRGYYEQLAFEPAQNVTVADMLADARSALYTVYDGYKGGRFRMVDHTDCWIAEEGCCSEDLLGPMLVRLLLAAGRLPERDPEPGFGGLDPRALAIRIVESETEDIDFVGIAEAIEGWHPDEVAAMSEEDFDKLHRRVDDLTHKAVVTVEIPDEVTT